MKEDLKAWCQQHHCEALAQLAVHEGSREALLRDGSVVPALETVAGSGLTQECRELAAAALSALSEKKLVMAVEGQKHIMLSCELVGAALHSTTCTQMSAAYLIHSCTSLMHSYGYVAYADQWDGQATIQRLNEWLIARGYVTWFDLTNMKGSTMDAMSDAIEGADVMLYGVSLAYKESANCRLEASWEMSRVFVSRQVD